MNFLIRSFSRIHGPIRLRWALFAGFCAVIALSLVVTGLAEAWTRTHKLREQRRQLLEATAFLTALRVRSYIESHSANLAHAARSLERAGLSDLDGVKHVLDDLRLTHMGLLTMLVADQQGRIVSTSPTLVLDEHQSALMSSVADRDYFQQAMRRGSTYVSDSFRGRGFGSDPIVAIAHPLHDPSGRSAGIVQAALDLARFTQLQDAGAVAEDAELVLLDGHGRIIYASDHRRFPYLSDFTIHQSGLDNLFSGHRRSPYAEGTLLSFAERPVLEIACAARPLETPGMHAPWTVLVYQDRSVLHASIATDLLQFTAVLAFGVIIAAGGAAVVARRITRAIESLAQAAQRTLSDGAPFTPGNSGIAELRQLTDTLLLLDQRQRDALARLRGSLQEKEALAAQLAASGRALEQANTELEARVRKRTRELQLTVEQLQSEVLARTRAERILQLENKVQEAISQAGSAEEVTTLALPIVQSELPGLTLAAVLHLEGSTKIVSPDASLASRLRAGRLVGATDRQRVLDTGQSRALSLPPSDVAEEGASPFVTCWLMPIATPAGKRFGTLECYAAQPLEPDPLQQRWLSHAGTLIGAAADRELERHAAHKLQIQLHESQRLRAMGTFAGGVAHTFNNLLVPITLYADSLEGWPALDAEGRRFAGQIKSAANRAAALIRQILVLARERLVSTRTVDLEQALHAASQTVLAEAGRSIPITICCSLTKPETEGDEEQIRQVFANVLLNALEAFAHQVQVVIEEAPATALPATLQTGRYQRVTIRDDGRGIAAEALPRVFEPFFSTKPAYAGRGLGLSFAHASVTAHGGLILVQSIAGVGTEVKIFLPLKSAPVEQAPGAGPATGEILLVDDDPAVGAATLAILEAAGHRVQLVSGAAEALPIIASGRIELLISDYTMPGMNGAELAARALQERPELRVVICSGYGHAGGARMPAKAVMLAKPFTQDQLHAAIHATRT